MELKYKGIKQVKASEFEPGKVYVKLNDNSQELYMRYKTPQSRVVTVISRGYYSYTHNGKMNTEITSKLKTRRCAIGYLEEHGAKFAELCSSTAFGTLPINTPILVRPRVNMPWVLKHYKDFDYDSKDVFRVLVTDPDKNTPKTGYRYAVVVALEKPK